MEPTPDESVWFKPPIPALASVGIDGEEFYRLLNGALIDDDHKVSGEAPRAGRLQQLPPAEFGRVMSALVMSPLGLVRRHRQAGRRTAGHPGVAALLTAFDAARSGSTMRNWVLLVLGAGWIWVGTWGPNAFVIATGYIPVVFALWAYSVR